MSTESMPRRHHTFDGSDSEDGARDPRTGRPQGLFGGAFRLGRAFGVELEVDWSLLIVFALVLFNLGAGVFPSWHPDWGFGLRWGVALGAAVAFFASVLAHEMSHALVGRAQGIPVSRITLFLFGGMAHMEGEPPTPKAEFLMAVVGPITSLVIGVAATYAGAQLAAPGLNTEILAEHPEEFAARLGPLATLLLWLGPINILLALFNIVPGFPLDGGRVLRSILWWSTSDMLKATRWASGVGRAVAWGLMGLGVLNLLHGGVGQGIWLMLIGWFLNNAATMSYRQLVLRSELEDVPVRRLMRTNLGRVEPDISIDALVRDHLMTSEQRAFPVERDGTLLGLVTLDDVRKVPQQRWPTATVAEVMTRGDDLVSVRDDESALEALEALARRDVDQLPVTRDGHTVGMVRRADILKWVAMQPGIGRR